MQVFYPFGKHYANIRNDASEHQLQALRSLEEKLSYAIDKGYISSFTSLIEALRQDYSKKI